MSYMFAYMTRFNRDISSWDLSAVETIACMFFRSTAFAQDLRRWELPARITQDASSDSSFGIFEGATSFDLDLAPPDSTRR